MPRRRPDRDQLQYPQSDVSHQEFEPGEQIEHELAETYITRIWRTALAEHLRAQIDPDQPDVRFELVVAIGPELFSIQHLPEKRGYAAIRACHQAATQYWADGDVCAVSLELTTGEDMLVRLVAAMAAGVGASLAAEIEAGKRRLQVFVT